MIFFCPSCLKRMVNTKKHMLPFSPDVKMIPAYIFFQFPRLFWKNILWSYSWFLKSEQKEWNCLHCTSQTLQNFDLFISFLSFSARIRGRIRIFLRIRLPDPDPKHWPGPTKSQSVSETLVIVSRSLNREGLLEEKDDHKWCSIIMIWHLLASSFLME